MVDSGSVKPLWGFGRAGWCLLPIAVGQAWVCLSRYDLRYDLLKLINEGLGTQAMLWFVSPWITFHHLSLASRSPEFGLLSLVYALVAMHLHPRRIAWYWYALIVGWAIMRPPLLPMMAQIGRPLGSWWSGRSAGGAWVNGLGLPLCATVLALIDVLILWRMTRSAIVLLAAAGGAIWGAGAFWISQPGQYDHWFLQIPWWPWHAVLIGSLLWWAVHARRTQRKPHEGQACGYDLRGSAGGVCPECGVPPGPGQVAAPPTTLAP